MDKSLVARLLGEAVGTKNVKLDEPMKNHTSFKVGGPADILVTPENIDHLKYILQIGNTHQVPVFVMGNGSNLIVRDKGIYGIVVKLFHNFNACEVKGNSIEAAAGLLLSRVANIAWEHGLAGLEFASGIPGTLGGAVAMNAGAYGGEMKDVVVRTEYMDRNGNMKILEGEEHQFGYRTSSIQKEGGIVIKSALQLRKGDKTAIKALMDDLNQRRKDKQPLDMPSAGSVFKRPEGYFAGKLIEDCGLRGCRIGGAEVSHKHCGFIVNAGGATAEDITKLIKHIQDTVMAQFGVKLETEVRIVGEE